MDRSGLNWTEVD